MSCLLNDPNFAEFPHNAINDAESFLWVMGYLIIRFEGPGKDLNEMTPELSDALEVFGGDGKFPISAPKTGHPEQRREVS